MSDYKKLKGRPKIKKVKAVSENQVKLFWKEVEGADKYAVLRRDEPDGEFVKIKWRKKLSFTDTVEPDKTYWYKISAYKRLEGKKNSTKESKTRAVVLSEIEPPLNLKAIPEKKAITLSWDKDPKASSYIVSRKNDLCSQILPVKKVKKPTFTDKKVVWGQVYHYTVQCVYADGEKERQGKFSPKVYTICLDSGKILERKTKGKTTVFSLRLVAGADGYILERSDSENGEYKEVARTKSNLELEIKDKAPSHFKTYFYKVRTYRSVKEEMFFSDSSEAISVKIK